MIDDRIQNFVFGLEVLVEISTGDAQRFGNLRERRVLKPLLVEQLICLIDNTISR